MSRAEFDHYAGNYRQIHQQNIAITGEGPEYFAHYKMRDFARLVQTLGAPRDGRYLDFGSGVGASVKPFYEELPQARLVCADVSADSLAESRKINGPQPEYLLLEDGNIPMADGILDGAFACCVFHHIPPAQHLATLAEIRRVLRPQAPLMIYEHNGYNPLTVHAVNTCPLDKNAILITGRSLRILCERAGFSAAKIDYRVFFPAALKALRPLENGLRWLPLGAQYALCVQA